MQAFLDYTYAVLREKASTIGEAAKHIPCLTYWGTGGLTLAGAPPGMFNRQESSSATAEGLLEGSAMLEVVSCCSILEELLSTA